MPTGTVDLPTISAGPAQHPGQCVDRGGDVAGVGGELSLALRGADADEHHVGAREVGGVAGEQQVLALGAGEQLVEPGLEERCLGPGSGSTFAGRRRSRRPGGPARPCTRRARPRGSPVRPRRRSARVGVASDRGDAHRSRGVAFMVFMLLASFSVGQAQVVLVRPRAAPVAVLVQVTRLPRWDRRWAGAARSRTRRRGRRRCWRRRCCRCPSRRPGR